MQIRHTDYGMLSSWAKQTKKPLFSMNYINFFCVDVEKATIVSITDSKILRLDTSTMSSTNQESVENPPLTAAMRKPQRITITLPWSLYQALVE